MQPAKRKILSQSLHRRRQRTTMDIDRQKLRKARKILELDTDTETVDMALNLLIINSEIEKGILDSFGKIPDFQVN